MAQKGFTDKHGERWPFAEINPVKDWQRFNASPATLFMLIASARERAKLPDGITASQAGSETRQMFIQDTFDYYPTTDAEVSAWAGTLKHAIINVDSDGLIVERRFFSKKNPRMSAKIDQASIVELTDDGTLVVDLFDLKTSKWYWTTCAIKDVWEKSAASAAWQLNLGAVLMEEETIYAREDLFKFGIPPEIATKIRTSEDPIRMIARLTIRVRNMYLECIPADASYNNIDEANKLGVDFRKVIVPVSRKPAEEVYAYYEDLLARKDAAKREGYAPLCKERWSNRKILDLRCKHFCSVSQECLAFSLARPEWHPLASEEELLRASLTKEAHV